MLISLNPFDKDGKNYGQYFENEEIFLFFGNRHFEKEHFNFFQDISFQFLKQIHSNNVLYFDKFEAEMHQADGHYTATKKLALVIQTADCLPILIYDQNHRWIMGLHAGWRGVENKITEYGLKKFLNEAKTPCLSMFVGPHIQYESFEVDEDVFKKLKKCVNSDIEYLYNESKNKYFINLKKIVHAQALELPLQIQELYFSNIDTLTNEEYSSFRRQKGPCRNWSFIYLK